LYFRT